MSAVESAPSRAARAKARARARDRARRSPDDPAQQAADGRRLPYWIALAVVLAVALGLRLTDARPVGWPERVGYVYVAPNFVTLLPGENTTLVVDWAGAEPSGRRLRLEGWNVPSGELDRG